MSAENASDMLVEYTDFDSRRVRDEQGMFALRNSYVRAFAGVTAVVGALGLLRGLGIVGMETNGDINAGHGQLLSVETILPQQCLLEYTNRVDGASASFTTTLKVKTFGVSVPTTFNMKETFSGLLTSKVCNEQSKVTPTWDDAKKQIVVKLPDNTKFESTVYRTNPANGNEFKKDGGFGAAVLSSTEDFLNVLPKVSVHTSDSLEGTLRNYAELGAIETSAKACGPVALNHARANYEKAIADNWYNQAATTFKVLGKTMPITREQVVAETPKIPSFEGQYEGMLAQIEAAKGIDMKIPTAKDLSCDDIGKQNG